MAAFVFPSSPGTNQIAVNPDNGASYKWDGNKWISQDGGGGVTLPLAITDGGTGAITGAGAFDSLSGASGVLAGVLSRNPAGQWAVTAPTGVQALPTGPLQTLQSTAGSAPVWNTNIGVGIVPQTNVPLALNYTTAAANLTAPWNGVLSIVATQPNVQDPTYPSADLAVLTANGNWQTCMFLTNTAASGIAACTSIYLVGDAANGGGSIQFNNSSWVPLNNYPPNRHSQFVFTTGGLGGMSFDSQRMGPIDFWVGQALSGDAPVKVGSFDVGGLTIPLGRSIGIGTPAPVNNSAILIIGQHSRDWDAAVETYNSNPLGFASFYVGGGESTTINPSDPQAVTRWSVPNRNAILGATDAIVSSNHITNANTHSWSFFHPLAIPPFWYEHGPSLWLSRDGLWIPSWFDSPIPAGQGIWIGGANGLIDIGGWTDAPGWAANMSLSATHPAGGAKIDLNCDNSVCTLSIVSSGTGGNRAMLSSTAPGGMWIQTWPASPVGGIHFTIGGADDEIVEQIDIDEHGFHMPNTWRDDDGVTLDDSGQAGLDIPAGDEVMLGAGAGLLMVTATSEPQSTALFLLGNQFARLISDTKGDGWADGYPPAPQGKLLVFCRDGKYFVSNGRAEPVHLNDMMFKNAAEN